MTTKERPSRCVISAYFNARTEAGDVRSNCLRSMEDLQATAELTDGDWVWLSDGEVAVIAQLRSNSKYGMVGVPDWDMTVYFDESDDDRGPVRSAPAGWPFYRQRRGTELESTLG